MYKMIFSLTLLVVVVGSIGAMEKDKNPIWKAAGEGLTRVFSLSNEILKKEPNKKTITQTVFTTVMETMQYDTTSNNKQIKNDCIDDEYDSNSDEEMKKEKKRSKIIPVSQAPAIYACNPGEKYEEEKYTQSLRSLRSSGSSDFFPSGRSRR